MSESYFCEVVYGVEIPSLVEVLKENIEDNLENLYKLIFVDDDHPIPSYLCKQSSNQDIRARTIDLWATYEDYSGETTRDKKKFVQFIINMIEGNFQLFSDHHGSALLFIETQRLCDKIENFMSINIRDVAFETHEQMDKFEKNCELLKIKNWRSAVWLNFERS